MSPEILEKLAPYPEHIQQKLLNLRSLIFDIAESNQLGRVKESLKWNELSYHVRHGSPIRIDWKEKTPEIYSIFFNCNTSLVETFRHLYADDLEFQGKRAINIRLDEDIKKPSLRSAILLALTYKKIKDLPLLGQQHSTV